jgi:hypothetical protein
MSNAELADAKTVQAAKEHTDAWAAELHGKSEGTLQHPALGYEYNTVPQSDSQQRMQSTKDEEQDAFAELARQVNQLQRDNAAKDAHASKDGAPEEVKRGFHAKTKANMIGEFTIYDDATFKQKMEAEYAGRISKDGKIALDSTKPGEKLSIEEIHDRVAKGLYAEPVSYHIIARYSNGVGVVHSDKETDVRGFAFKVLERADGTPLPAGGSNSGTQDFLMTNMPVPMGKDAYEFMDFAHYNATRRGDLVDDLIKLPGFKKDHPDVAHSLLQLKFKDNKLHHIPSLATQTYWSGSPYRLGSDEQGSQLSKFMVKPLEAYRPNRSMRPAGEEKDNDNYLSQDLAARINRGDIKYTFYVQLQTDPVKTPAENSNKEWTEKDSLAIPVGEITLYKGQDFRKPEAQEFANHLSLTPWHWREGQKPAGSINRVREKVYGASAALRTSGDPHVRPNEVTAQDVKNVFGEFRK